MDKNQEYSSEQCLRLQQEQVIGISPVASGILIWKWFKGPFGINKDIWVIQAEGTNL